MDSIDISRIHLMNNISTILQNGKNVKDLLRNWKKEFLANAPLAFDNKREDNLREKLAEERKAKADGQIIS